MSERTNWKARVAAVVAADGDEWDRLSEAYDEDWIAAYRVEFILFAVSRPGWTEPMATESLDAADMPRDAMADAGWRGDDPATKAAADVIECEIEASNA